MVFNKDLMLRMFRIVSYTMETIKKIKCPQVGLGCKRYDTLECYFLSVTVPRDFQSTCSVYFVSPAVHTLRAGYPPGLFTSVHELAHNRHQ